MCNGEFGLINATELPRVMACQGSRLLGGSMPPSSDDPTARNEGTAAHWVITHAFETGTSPEDYLNQKAPNGVIITNAMLKNVAEYFATIQNDAVRNSMVHGCEADASFDTVRARTDWFTFDGQTLTIRDFKFGYRIVEPRENWTLIAYAIGLCIIWQMQPSLIRLFVHQPRVPHPEGTVREWAMTPAELANRYDRLSHVLANPSDQLQTGPWCERCPNVTVCPAIRSVAFAAIDISMTAHAESLRDEQINEELALLQDAEKRLKARRKQLEDLAVYRMKEGAVLDGFGLERSLSNREWREGLTPEFLTLMLGVDCSKNEAISPSQAISRGASESVVSSLSDRTETGLKLVRISAHKRAEKLFGKVKG